MISLATILKKYIMYKFLFVFSIFLFFSSCKKEKTLSAQDIVDKSIKVSGGDNYKSLDFEFDFRGRHYKSKLNNGNFEYSRITSDSSQITIDSYGNVKPFERLVNLAPVKMPDSLSSRIENSINSVNYFVLMPHGLNDLAVNKKFLEKEAIKGKEYYKIQVTFNQEGGGEDFDDVYIYWFNSETFKIDFLAYSFAVNGGGMRFREAYNERIIKEQRFVDYNNYKPENKKASLFDLGKLFEKNQLKLLSKIETENIVVH